MIVDSYCLQGIITEEDRKSVFSAVKDRLKSDGYYLISTVMFNIKRHHPEDKIIDPKTGKVYNRYDENALFDPESEIYYDIFFEDQDLSHTPSDYEGTFEIDGTWYIIKRIYRKPETLSRELQTQGFKVLYQIGNLGENIVCKIAK